ncbi:MAG TPA: MGMT family protein [Sorangium sp.]|nr:MGMT family protein [Sorangium sp.]
MTTKDRRARRQAPEGDRRLTVIPGPRRGRREPAALPETISWWDAFYRVIRRIPAGRVCTYGAVAAMAGHPRAARHVGYALAALKETGEGAGVPWQRVLGSRPRHRAAVTIKDPVGGALQRKLLEAEGVEFDERGNVSLERFGWSWSTPVAAPAKKVRGAAPAKKVRVAAPAKKARGAAPAKKARGAAPRKRRS